MKRGVQVRSNVQAALEGLGLADSVEPDGVDADAALAAASAALKPVMGVTWPSGRPENN